MTTIYYQKHNEKLHQEAHERYYSLSQEEKEKSVSIIVNVIKIFLRSKSNSKLSISEIII